MAGLFSGVAQAFGHLGGSSAKRDRSDYILGQERLGDVFNRSMGFGKDLYNAGRTATGQGLQDLGTSGNFFRRLTSGNRTATTQAMAPQINAAEQQGDALRRQEANLGTARGGGTAGTNQQMDTNRLAQIDNMLFGAQTGAAGELANVGRTEAGVGLGETGQGLQATGLAGNIAGTGAELAMKSRSLSDELHRQAVTDYSKAFQSLMGGSMGNWLNNLGNKIGIIGGDSGTGQPG